MKTSNLYARLLLRYLTPLRMQVVVLALLLLISIALQLVNPRIVSHFLDQAKAGASDRTLLFSALLFIAVALVQQVLSVLVTYRSEILGWQSTNAMREDLVEHCLALDQSFHKSRTAGEMIERVDGDVGMLANFFSKFVLEIVGNVLLVIGVLIILFTINVRVGAAISVFTVLALSILYRMRAWSLRPRVKERQVASAFYGFVGETLTGAEDLRTLGAEPYVQHRLIQLFREWIPVRVLVISVWCVAFGVSLLVFSVSDSLALVLAGHLFTIHAVTIGTVYAIFAYIALLAIPLDRIQRQMQDLQKVDASLTRIQELLTTESALKDGTIEPLPAGALNVDVDRLRFSYDVAANPPVLNDLSFQLEAGRVLGILGRTGSGKTTLARLLARLYDPQGGEVRIGGMLLPDITLAEVRRRVALVTQDVQLLDGSIRDNLTFFNPEVSDQQLLGALDTLGLLDWCQAQPQGLDTRLEANSLSAGEAQLLAFARVFLRDPGLVILDEASSRLDPATEAVLERAIDRLLDRRTGVIIAHRLRTLDRVDDVLILEDGCVAEFGSRAVLAARPQSRYAHLLRTAANEALA